MKYSTILFDLDGTITDPKEGITKSVQFALKRMGIEENDLEKLIPFIGAPLKAAFQEFYGLSENEAIKAIAFYREYFADKGIFENKVYEGIEDLLSELKSKNKRLILATSKVSSFALRIMRHFGLADYLDEIVGSNLDGTRSEKTEILRYILDTYKVLKEGTVMVGDRKYDAVAAAANGIESIAVGYGYGSDEELKNANFTLYEKDVSALKAELMK
ncbi:MAG: HAD-IA family hydrolase [Fibrobacteraceae bacterium]|nr:HAD-IA family hydrolase [Fibrobacteraceae bacterium]